MPLFDFRCRACEAAFEALVRPPQEPVCPSCGSADVEKLVTTSFSVRSGGLSQAARRDVQKQQAGQKRDHDAFQREVERKHLDD